MNSPISCTRHASPCSPTMSFCSPPCRLHELLEPASGLVLIDGVVHVEPREDVLLYWVHRGVGPRQDCEPIVSCVQRKGVQDAVPVKVAVSRTREVAVAAQIVESV